MGYALGLWVASGSEGLDHLSGAVVILITTIFLLTRRRP